MKALVTGGGGFLGSAIVRRVIARGDSVRSFSRQRYPELEKLGVEQFSGDLADANAVDRAAADCDIVFHVAAKAGIWGPYREFRDANIIGTRNVIAACRKLRINRLVYTSSPSVVHTGHDLQGVSESVPISRHFEAHYPATKAIAEREVLAANGAELATVALRPHLIWGPGDVHLVPRLIERAKQGKLRLIGDGSKLVDVTYIDNAVDAHINAADRLSPDSPVAGKVYFISQGEPVRMAYFINRILAAANLPSLKKSLSFPIAYGLAWLIEFAATAANWQNEPRLTRFVVRQFATAHWFDISAARRDLEYTPRVSTEEGLRRLATWLHSN
jgi:nucleoside-diphosphate-sugar epimerase